MYLTTILLLALSGFTGANLSLHDPHQPVTSDEVALTGSTATLKCTVENHAESSLQWSNPAQQTLYFGDKRALRDSRIQLVSSTANELTISISNVALSDEGEYTCSIFTMPVRIAKAMITVLGVPQKPQIFGFETPFKEDQKAKLTCKTFGSKPAANFRWYKGLEELHGAKTNAFPDTNSKTFNVTSVIEFQINKEDDGGEITCTVGHDSQPDSVMSTSHKIQVLYKPSAKIESWPNMPREGEELRLQCDGYGNPAPHEYNWQRENTGLPLSTQVRGNTLLFQNLNKSDSGTYVCEAVNAMGKVSTIYKLDVNDPSPIPSTSSIDHAVIGGVVAVIAFILFCLLIVLGRYLIRHKGTYLTHEAKGSDDAPDADTAIINAEGGQGGSDDKKEYFI
ncbi:cell adhesion molecule 3 isoform X2 [Bombina bombina]|uniref:cell adhesion molecule 3 isoform X2 n=1 Tax=Bombina bombina TaxID=8345 RepID=UPI00235A7475|nr:cell adhesion molecule 3 isoform X2 [Bombina bombina]